MLDHMGVWRSINFPDGPDGRGPIFSPFRRFPVWHAGQINSGSDQVRVKEIKIVFGPGMNSEGKMATAVRHAQVRPFFPGELHGDFRGGDLEIVHEAGNQQAPVLITIGGIQLMGASQQATRKEAIQSSCDMPGLTFQPTPDVAEGVLQRVPTFPGTADFAHGIQSKQGKTGIGTLS